MDTSTLERRIHGVTGEWMRLSRWQKIRRVIILAIILTIPGALAVWALWALRRKRGS